MRIGIPTNLQQALRLPNATLAQETLEPEQLSLWLLNLQDEQVTLDAQAIAHFWQQLPYWAFAWAGGRALAHWLHDNPSLVAGKRVLDFGCGSGIAGIAAKLAGASEVWVADLDANAIQAAHCNAMLNNVEVKQVAHGWPEIDVLLASDVLYDISACSDLQALMLKSPQWLLAESRFVKPTFVDLKCLARYSKATLPRIGDFDEAVDVEIYCRTAEHSLG